MGNALLYGVPTGATVYGEKGFARGYSGAWSGQGDLKVRLAVSRVNLTVTTTENDQPVIGANVRVVSRAGDVLAEKATTGTAGEARFELDAGSLVSIEAVFSNDRLSRSQSILLDADQRIELQAPPINLTQPQISFDGFFDADNAPVSELGKGNRYWVRLDLVSEQGIAAGVFVTLNEDKARIVQADAADWSVIGGTTLDPSNGTTIDLSPANLGFPSKWVQTNTLVTTAGRQTVELLVELDSDFDANYLTMGYRAWTHAGNVWALTPADSGFNATNGGDSLLYTQTRTQTIAVVPGEPVCALPDCGPSAGRALSLEVDSNAIVALSPAILRLSVTDAQTGAAVGTAMVQVERVGPDASTSTQISKVRSDGTLSLAIPSVSPHTIFNITAFANGYDPAHQTVEAMTIALFSPFEWTVGLSAQSPMQALDWTVSNISSVSLSVKKTEIQGDFTGVLDVDALNDSLGQSVGKSIDAGSDLLTNLDWSLATIPSVVAGSTSHGIQIVELESGSDVFVSALAVTVRVLKAGEFTESCLSINRSAWLGTTAENRSDFTFLLENKCGTDFNALEAQIVWNSDNLGSVEVSLADATTTVLKPKEFVPVLPQPRTGSITGLLSFAPTSKELGKTARFSVYLAAKPKNGSRQFAETVSAQIDLANLQQCMTITPSAQTGIEIGAAGSAGFSVDSSRCGDTSISVSLCKDDAGCSGGAKEGTIKVAPTEFDLSTQNPKQEVTVSRVDLAGTYDIGLWVKSADSDWTN
ncbi:MAG: hypothetical protein Q7R47_01045, partial [Candidatus Diapherotrites archaeon]|nr:hypothetical protein [Candidatus Diapherotrites archaeon]